MEIRFGILGCGAIAAHHAQAIAMVPGAVLAGAADARPESARTFCEKYGGQAFESMEAMLASPAVDAVCVLTPSGLHAQHAIQAADAGKHVLVEKPVALNLLDADRIIAAGERNHVCIGVVSQYRFADSILRLKGAVDQGLLGRIVTCGRFDEILPKPGIFRLQLLAGHWPWMVAGAHEPGHPRRDTCFHHAARQRAFMAWRARCATPSRWRIQRWPPSNLKAERWAMCRAPRRCIRVSPAA